MRCSSRVPRASSKPSANTGRRCPIGALAPAYSGVRSKIHRPGQVAPDFRIDGPVQRGVRGLVNLFGIESGLTSALAIAEETAALLEAAD